MVSCPQHIDHVIVSICFRKKVGTSLICEYKNKFLEHRSALGEVARVGSLLSPWPHQSQVIG